MPVEQTGVGSRRHSIKSRSASATESGLLHRGSPGRLHTLVVPQHIAPPPVTRTQVLPFEHLAWENFERLCLRLALGHGTIESSIDHDHGDGETRRLSAHDASNGRLYGSRGQKQHGIDLYVRLSASLDEGGISERVYLTLQSRRIASLSAAGLRKAVSEFLAGTWASVSRVFVYAVSLSAVRTQLADEIKTQTERLHRVGIDFEVWDAELLSPRLKHQPLLVDDFFGRAWVEEFCGHDAAEVLGTRLDAQQIGALRDQLGSFYTSFFNITDSGMAALQNVEAPQLDFRQRFVLPDVVVAALGPGGSATIDPIGTSTAEPPAGGYTGVGPIPPCQSGVSHPVHPG